MGFSRLTLLPDYLAVFDKEDLKTRNVDDQKFPGDVAKDPSHALEAGSDLIDPGLNGNIELLDGAWTHFSVRVDAMAHLKILGGGFETTVEIFRVGRVGVGEIAGDPESLPEFDDSRTAGTRLENWTARHHRPPTTGHDGSVFFQR